MIVFSLEITIYVWWTLVFLMSYVFVIIAPKIAWCQIGAKSFLEPMVNNHGL